MFRLQFRKERVFVPFPGWACSSGFGSLRGGRLTDQHGSEGLQPLPEVLPDLDRQHFGERHLAIQKLDNPA